MGAPPVRIDVVTGIPGISFTQAWPNRVEAEIDGVPLLVIGKSDLVIAKRASGRP